MVIGIILGVIALIVLFFVSTYNGLVKLRNMVKDQCVFQISRLIETTKMYRELTDGIFKLFGAEESFIIDEPYNFYVSTVWDILCDTRDVPELDNYEFEDFQDSVWEASSRNVTATQVYDQFTSDEHYNLYKE
jgi:hypothetical protein